MRRSHQLIGIKKNACIPRNGDSERRALGYRFIIESPVSNMGI
jgi:hypothetical protein